MSTILREPRIETLHDHVVSLVAQRWAKAFRCKVTINTNLEVNSWAWRDQQADVMGWTFSPGGDSMQWIAEIETEDSLSESDVTRKWKSDATLEAPFYMIVPKGYRERVLKLGLNDEITFSGIYEFSFLNGSFHLF